MDEFDAVLRTRPVRWVYHQEVIPLQQLGPALTLAGKDGWELVASHVGNLTPGIIGGNVGAGMLCIFKRPAVIE